MKKYIVLFVTLMMVLSLASIAFGENLNGLWTISQTWNHFVNGEYVSSGSSTPSINIINTLSSSNEFTGEFISISGVIYGAITGKIIKATPPYTQDLIIFRRIDYSQNYSSLYTGFLLNETTVIEGHYLDVNGNSGTFTMTKQ